MNLAIKQPTSVYRVDTPEEEPMLVALQRLKHHAKEFADPHSEILTMRVQSLNRNNRNPTVTADADVTE